MAVLIYCDAGGQTREREFSEGVRIGSDPQRNDVVLPMEWGVAPEHAVIARAVLNRMPVLVDLSGGDTWVNGRRVVRLQVLHHGDILQVGQASLTLWEVRIARLPAGSRTVGRECPVCKVEFMAGDEVIACPRCRTVHHRDCWFSIPICSFYGCEYPVHETVTSILAPWVAFEELGEQSELVKREVQCRAGNPRDQVPFQKKQRVAYCPQCNTPFHLECWLTLTQCPVCQYGVKTLIDQVFGAAGEYACGPGAG